MAVLRSVVINTLTKEVSCRLFDNILQQKISVMSDADFKKLMELAERRLTEPVTKEQALRILVRVGILDESGEFTAPYQNLATVVKSI